MGITATVGSLLAYQHGERKGAEEEEALAAGKRETEKAGAKGYWETYQKWGEDAATKFERATSSMKSRMAAGGIKPGSEQWDVNLQRIQGEYESELQTMREGATGTILSEWAESTQLFEQEAVYDEARAAAFAESGLGSSDYFEYEPFVATETLGMSEYLGATFGTVGDTTEGVPDITKPGTAIGAMEDGRRIAATGAEATANPWRW